MFSNLTERQLEEGSFKTLLRSKRHYDFVRNVEEIENCYRPRGYSEEVVDACRFVMTTAHCQCVANMFNYLKLYLCVLKWDLTDFRAVPTLILGALILCLYFTSLYVNVKYFLIPNTISLAQYWNMDNYNFGLIVLAILFNLPFHMTMIFTCFEYHGSDALIHAGTFGKMFTCFVLGLCMLSCRKAFQLKASRFLREMFFIFIAAIHLYATVYQQMVNDNLPPVQRKKSIIHIHAYISLLVYVIYVISILINGKKPNTTTHNWNEDLENRSTIESDAYPYPETIYNPIHPETKPLQQFIACVNPWQAMAKRKAFLRILMSPFYVFYALFLPVVDSNRQMNGWCKWIVCNSCLVLSFYCLIQRYAYEVVTYCGLGGLLALLLLSFLTHPQREPKTFRIVSLWGLCIGFASMNIVDLEICCILWQFLNYFVNTTNDILVIMAFPLSYVFVGFPRQPSFFRSTCSTRTCAEGVFVVALIKSGYREMALGFVMGTIMFIAYSALPAMLFSICFSDEHHIYSLTDDTTTAYVFTLVTQLVTIIGLSITGFELRPSISIFFALVAAIYCVFMILSNLNIVHPYGTIHSLTVFVDADHSQWT